ncbi:reverse transcriptase RNA-dependent DNA polymerase [Nitzschia inconspicua]|uniref:Reverse transcriptase RNA-dependent DNA polymerase n=1 Tax=Nitzschia inconspicua TaxID=303405 RepID=A0A9K3Q720_9STRA|nr:reverse transcriptase RNA-dependent DNA polymerase [Nitzschia inconspicua]
MQADMDELLHLKLDGTILEILLRMEPSYCQFVTYERGKKVLYTQLDKVLYGALQSALLFWKKLTAYVVDTLGFEINPFDACVANKVIKGKQCTIVWYVDDLKLSHEDPAVVEDIFAKLQAEFGKEAPLTVTRGKVHNYLGMRIDYSVDGKVQFTMPSVVNDIITQLPALLATGPSMTPAANHLFKVNQSADKLSQSDLDLLHRMTTQLLYLCKRARPDLQTAVAFLTTRVVAPDCDGIKKFGRCKINTRNSTEAELLRVNDAMSIILWTRHFLEAQGYTMKENVIYQDNESAILLEKNGRQSSTKRTRHLEVRYFFVTDNVHRGKLSIEYCPTGDMIADYFTKPLQGSQFRKILKQILNIDDVLIDSSPQECVGNNKEEPTHAIQDVADESRPRQDDSRPVNVVEDSDTKSANTSEKAFMVKNRSYADVVRNQKKA